MRRMLEWVRLVMLTGSEHGPMVANNKHKLEENYEREYKNMVREW